MTAPQLLFLRSCASAIIFLGLLNKNIGDYMYRKIPRKLVTLLALRVASGIGFLVCIYTAAKALPLITVTLVQNLSPLVTAVLSYLLLKKGLTILDSGVLIVSFLGVVILITGSMTTEHHDPWVNPANESLLWPIISLALYPFLNSGAILLSRQLRSIHEYSVSSYIAFSMVAIYGFTSIFQEESTFGIVK